MALPLRRKPKKRRVGNHIPVTNLIAFFCIIVAFFVTVLNISLFLSGSSTSNSGGNIASIPSDAAIKHSKTRGGTASRDKADSIKPLKKTIVATDKRNDFKEVKKMLTQDKNDDIVRTLTKNEIKELKERLAIDKKSNEVKCDNRGDCKGFFLYSGPNNSRDAIDTLHEAVQEYTSGNENNEDGQLIFTPLTKRSEECTKEWGLAGGNWRQKGMSVRGEDMKIFETFFHKKEFFDGSHFYLEVGAHDGIWDTNSRFFDICLGWEGLLVEGNPRNFERMEKLRPNAHHLGVAPSCKTSDIAMFPNHRFTNAEVNTKKASNKVHCGPLSYYLEQIGIAHIDFMALDVVGSELDVLKTVNFDKVKIDVIAEGGSRVEEVRSFLQKKGYLLLKSVSVSKTDVYLHKSVCVRYDFPECE